MILLKTLGLMIISGANVFAMHSLYNVLNVDVDAVIFSTTLVFLAIAVAIYSSFDSFVLSKKIEQMELEREIEMSNERYWDNSMAIFVKPETEKKYKRTYSENAIEKMSNRAKSRKRDENGKFI